ncbi:hypothetical protein GSI_08191 [Ganoderma sinense ZZ0214-1]|uniref:Autophagy-related protein 27 n=1 Tax=Ganoderma sinense ZZ0214-1 TaxID=1077348 RepID=A0A2G8S7J1_9APHY|nr:hypothetical protein GSI_08191 [Ganoderma sinense ZZ0214-1]
MPSFHRHPVSRAVLLTLLSALVAAQDDQKPFDCHVTIGQDKYDLTGLKGEFAAERDISLPPSTIHDTLSFNLCEDLTTKKDVPAEDQCPSGTRACLVRTTKKNGKDDQVLSVIPLANSSASAVSYEATTSPKGLQLTFAGSSYPSPAGSDPIPQHLHVKLLCSSNMANLNFTSYDGKDLYIQWEAPAGCLFESPPDEGTKDPSKGGDDKSGSGGEKEQESVGSGLGYFFLLLFLAFVAYFALGAYYNYSTYGASGADLIPSTSSSSSVRLRLQEREWRMAKKQAYVVLVGVKPGVYTNWLDVTQNTVGVPHAQFQGFTYFEEASEYFERALRRGATRAVKLPPPLKDHDEDKDEDKPEGAGRKNLKKPEGRSDGGPVKQRRRRIEDSPAESIAQTPASTPKGSSAGRAARDAQIAAALAGVRRNGIGPSASSPNVISSDRERRQQQERSSRRTAALARSATEPAYHFQVQPQVQNSPTVSESTRTPVHTRPRSTRRTVELPSPEPDARTRVRTRTRETRTGSEPHGPVSDIPTDETRTTNRFTNSPGLSTPRIRYAQSLSYASSPSLASSDIRTHISSPSSFGTRYFPEDWLARIGLAGQRREAGVDRDRRGDDRNSILSTSLSKYATAPNTPEQVSTELEDEVEEVRGVASASPSSSVHDRAGLSKSSSSSPRSAVTRSKTWSSAPSPPPATATEVISSPSATSTPRHTGSTSNSTGVNYSLSPSLASVPPSSPPSEPKKKTATRVTRSLSEAQVQTESPSTQARRRKNPEAEAGVQTDSPRRCKNPEVGVQAAPPSPHKRRHLDNQVQTSPVASALRASTAVGDVPVRPLPGGFPCACEHPEYACINCGERPRVEEGGGRSAASSSRSSRAPSTTTASPVPSEFSSAPSSPAPSGTPASASAVSSLVSTRSNSSRSHGGHTPIMGPSESRSYSRSPTARIQESLEMMSFSEAARGVGAEVVVHDVSFDPRSPIQRGTNIPAGTSGSAVRPSPAMAPVPMGSLGLLFES